MTVLIFGRALEFKCHAFNKGEKRLASRRHVFQHEENDHTGDRHI
jgi:hypothetical protein